MSPVKILILVCVACTVVWVLASPQRNGCSRRRPFFKTLLILAGIGGLAWLFVRPSQTGREVATESHVVRHPRGYVTAPNRPERPIPPSPPIPPTPPSPPQVAVELPWTTVQVSRDDNSKNGRKRSRTQTVSTVRVNGQEPSRWILHNPKFYKDEKEAYRSSLELARDQLVSAVREIRPETQWSPSTAEVEKLVHAKAFPVKEVDPPIDGNKTFYSGRLELQWTDSAQRELLHQLHLERAQERHGTLTQGMLAVLALLATTLGYLRIDDWTKGYYSGWLKAGVVAALAALAFTLFRA